MKLIKTLTIAVGLMAISTTGFAMTMVPGTGETTIDDFTLAIGGTAPISGGLGTTLDSPDFYGIELTEESTFYVRATSNIQDLPVGLSLLDSMGMAISGLSGSTTLKAVLDAGSYFLRLDIGDGEVSYSGGITVSPVPVPAAGILFASALFGAGFIGRRKKKATQSNMIGAFARAA